MMWKASVEMLLGSEPFNGKKSWEHSLNHEIKTDVEIVGSG